MHSYFADAFRLIFLKETLIRTRHYKFKHKNKEIQKKEKIEGKEKQKMEKVDQ
jgi:hypothetical protein